MVDVIKTLPGTTIYTSQQFPVGGVIPKEPVVEVPTMAPTSPPPAPRVPTNPMDNWKTSTAAFKDQSGGACGYSHLKLTEFPFMHTAEAISNSQIDSYSGNCGMCWEVECSGSPLQYWDERVCTGKNVVVQVTGKCECPSSNPGHYCCKSEHHMVLSKSAMAELAGPLWDGNSGVGVISINYRRVKCDVSGGIRVVIDQYSNAYWFQLMFENFGGSGVANRVEIREAGSSSWYTMWRVWGANWRITEKAIGHPLTNTPLSLRVTSQYYNTKVWMIDMISTPQGSKIYQTTQQFW